MRLERRESVHLVEELQIRYPFWQYFEAFRKRRYPFLLDSAKEASDFGGYSFIGSDPFLTYSARRRGSRPADGARIIKSHTGDASAPAEYDCLDVMADLQETIRNYTPATESNDPRLAPLRAGAVGYFAYEAGYLIEELPDNGQDYLQLPDVWFGFYDVILSHNHKEGASCLSVIGRGRTREEAQTEAERLRATTLAHLQVFENQFNENARHCQPLSGPLFADFDKQRYCQAIEACKRHILRGDAYEICLTHRLRCAYEGDSWRLYRSLRAISPASFAGFLDLGAAQVLSSSPERFLSLSRDRVVESRPIKGTRPRGATAKEDGALRHDLATSAKDRAENIMIVDLVRNDLGRVCEIGSVCVPELMAIEEYATVFQLVSTVRGILAAENGPLDLVRAAFPGGSMTGAPKIEAMKIIDQLEPVKRGIYSGAIGYIDFHGALDLNIVIRTIVLKDGWAYFNAGGAVVADSDPEEEYAETMNKASAMMKALRVESAP